MGLHTEPTFSFVMHFLHESQHRYFLLKHNIGYFTEGSFFGNVVNFPWKLSIWPLHPHLSARQLLQKPLYVAYSQSLFHRLVSSLFFLKLFTCAANYPLLRIDLALPLMPSILFLILWASLRHRSPEHPQTQDDVPAPCDQSDPPQTLPWLTGLQSCVNMQAFLLWVPFTSVF